MFPLLGLGAAGGGAGLAGLGKIGGAVLGGLSGLFGGGGKKESAGFTRVDPRLPPTVVDVFSQMGFSPESRGDFMSALAPFVVGEMFKSFGATPPASMGEIKPATNLWDLYGMNPDASIGKGISGGNALPGMFGQSTGSSMSQGSMRQQEARRRIGKYMVDPRASDENFEPEPRSFRY